MMKQAVFNFHGELNDLLRADHRDGPFLYLFTGAQSVKHLIESLRVPHTEVGRVAVNGLEVDLGSLIESGDQVDVFPMHLEEHDPDEIPSFLLDNHLGKLAAYLRMCGFDAAYRNDYQDAELALTASQEARILLTRDRGLLMRKSVARGYCLHSLEPEQQLLEVLRRYRLREAIRPFQRCLRCNHLLQPVEKAAIMDRLRPLTRQYFDVFHICPACGQIYWKGSHYDHMVNFLCSIQRKELNDHG
jgi:uncharacterized protein